MNAVRNAALITAFFANADVALQAQRGPEFLGQKCGDGTEASPPNQPCTDYTGAGYMPIFPVATIPISAKNPARNLTIASVSVAGGQAIISVTKNQNACYEAGKTAAAKARAQTATICKNTHGDTLAVVSCTDKAICAVSLFPRPAKTEPAPTPQ